MSKFDRYVLSQLLVLFGFFSLILVAIYWINQAVQVFDSLIGDGQSARAVFSITLLSLPLVIAIVLPISAFAATVFVTNRLNSDSELVVVQATGFSPFRLALPVFQFGVIVAIMTSILMHFLVPASTREAAIQRADLANNMTARFLSPGEFLHPAKGITFYIGELTNDGVLKSIFLTDARNADEQTAYVAREAFLLADVAGPKLVMIDGSAQTYTAQGQRLAVTRFDQFAFDIGRLITGVRTPRPSTRQLFTPSLLKADPTQITDMNSTKAKFQWEVHNRITQALLAIAAALIGFATLLIGAFSRFGVWRQILAAIVLLLLFKMFDNTVSTFARGTEDMWPLMYIPLVVASALVYGLLQYSARNRRVRTNQHAGQNA